MLQVSLVSYCVVQSCSLNKHIMGCKCVSEMPMVFTPISEITGGKDS